MGRIDLDLDRGVVAGFDTVTAALAALRTRSLATWAALPADAWSAPSRCSEWTVHDTVRHVRDCVRIHVARLRHDPPPFEEGGFDNQASPNRWLEATAGEDPATTLADLAALAAAEADALAARDPSSGEHEIGPYGPVHWTTFTTHMFWDAWQHDRDVTVALGAPHAASPGEDLAAAAYGLFLAAVTVRLAGADLDAHVALASLRFRAMPGRVHDDEAGGEPDLVGDLYEVVDALAGRGPAVADVLRGDADAVERLGWLRSFMTA